MLCCDTDYVLHWTLTLCVTVTEAGAWAEVEIDLRGRAETTRRRMLTTRMERRVGEAEAAEDSEDTGRATSAGEESQEGTRRATAPREMRQIVRSFVIVIPR